MQSIASSIGRPRFKSRRCIKASWCVFLVIGLPIQGLQAQTPPSPFSPTPPPLQPPSQNNQQENSAGVAHQLGDSSKNQWPAQSGGSLFPADSTPTQLQPNQSQEPQIQPPPRMPSSLLSDNDLRSQKLGAEPHPRSVPTNRNALDIQQPNKRFTPRQEPIVVREPDTFDSMVRPAGFQNQEISNNDLAEQLLNQIDINKITTALPGDPITLTNALANVRQDQRQKLIRAYWNAYTSYAHLRYAQTELMWLERLNAPIGQADRMLLDAAKMHGRNQATKSELAFNRSQGLLSELLPQNPHDLLPLPQDMPLLGRYRTNFEIYETRGAMPIKLERIHENLPLQHQLIHDQAKSVQTSRAAVSQTITAYNQGQATLAAALESIRLCHAVHAAFADAVNDYNQAIADYALTIAPQDRQPHQVVAMLIPGSGMSSIDDRRLPVREARNNSIYSTGNQIPSQQFNEEFRTPPSSPSPSFQPTPLERRGNPATNLPANNPYNDRGNFPGNQGGSSLAPQNVTGGATKIVDIQITGQAAGEFVIRASAASDELTNPIAVENVLVFFSGISR